MLSFHENMTDFEKKRFNDRCNQEKCIETVVDITE